MIINKYSIFLVFTFLLFSGCEKDNESMNPNTSDSERPIGSASMESDGTIILQLRAEAGDGSIGEGYFYYKPTAPNYDEVIKHLGGLSPGESKFVPPWPDNESQSKKK